MSSARQGLSFVGQAIGYYFGGPIGGAVGGVIGGEIGGLIDGPPEGPRLGDMSAPQIEYGGKIGRLYGGPRWFEVGGLWMSEKRESSEVVGGKGGDSGVETFSYHCDMLVRILESREGTPCEVIAVTGIEVDGELKWTNLAGASAESLQASQEQEIWASMTVLTGSETQAPWSVMEAAVGADNAIAYRGYCTVGFESFLLGENGMPRRIRIQAITAGTQAIGDVYFLFNGEGASIVDETPWGNDPNANANNLLGTPAAFGSGALVNASATGTFGMEFGCSVPWTEDQHLTGEVRIRVGSLLQAGTLVFLHAQGPGGTMYSYGLVRNTSPDLVSLFLTTYGETVFTGFVDPDDFYPIPAGAYFMAAVDYDGATGTVTAYLNGALVLQHTASSIPSMTSITGGQIGLTSNMTIAAGDLAIDGARMTRRYRRYPEAFTPPTSAPTNDISGQWTPGTVDLRDILEYEASRCAPLTSANIDFSAAEGIEVGCHIAIGSAAEAIQPLLTRFWFDLYSSDKLYLVRRGGDVEQEIPFAWTGSGNGGRTEGFSGLIRSNDVEVPKRKAITYSNMLADGEADTRTGDRESVGVEVDTLSMNLNMIPSEAQGLADTCTADVRIAGHTGTVRLGARHGLRLQPGSVIELTDHHGNTYRCLVRRIVWDRWAWECDVRLDDPTVLAASGIAVDLDQRAITVVPPPDATLYVLDIPLLRVEDNAPGEYVAVTCTGRWRGATLYKSSDDVTYTNMGEVANKATAGVCDSVLPAFEGWGWDNSSTLTVTLDDGSGGELSSATKTAIEASRSLNLAAVGVHGRWELIQFATATLLTGSTYQLSGFLRNLFGTEWASGDHDADDAFVLLTPALGRINGAVSDLAQTRYYKAVPRGRSISGVTAESIVCEEQCLLPYAPTDVWNDAGTIRWNRRSRVEGAIGLDPPLGENTERYDAELYDGVALEDSDSGLTSPEWTPVDPSGLTVRVYQLSELVGRGHVAEKELT